MISSRRNWRRSKSFHQYIYERLGDKTGSFSYGKTINAWTLFIFRFVIFPDFGQASRKWYNAFSSSPFVPSSSSAYWVSVPGQYCCTSRRQNRWENGFKPELIKPGRLIVNKEWSNLASPVQYWPARLLKCASPLSCHKTETEFQSV